MADRTDHDRALEKLGALIDSIRVATLTTVSPDGALRGRPLLVQRYERDGTAWFLTHHESSKVEELERDPRVQLGFNDLRDNSYVCASGTAEVVRDRDRIRELWNDIYKEFFPDGPDDPDVALIRVRLDRAEFWDAPKLADPWVAGVVATSEDSPPDAHGFVQF